MTDLLPSVPERQIRAAGARPRRLLFVCTFFLATAPALAGSIQLPERAPIPQPRPEASAEPSTTEPRPDALPSSERACREQLRKLDVVFREADDVAAEEGCSLPHPIEITRLSERIRLDPPATLECETALAAARFFQSAASDLARKHFKSDLVAVRQASGYVCRPINGGKNLSEHAFGKALDIAGLAFSDETEIEVTQYGDGGEPAGFLKELRAAACGPFSTVLGPGTNADHEDHFHLDMKERRAPYCR